MNNAKVDMPRYPTAMNMPGLLTFASEFMHAVGHGIVVCDGRSVRFVDPCGLAVLGCIADRFRETETSLQLVNFSEEALSYISRMGTFSGLIDLHAELGARHVKNHCKNSCGTGWPDSRAGLTPIDGLY